MSIFGRFRKKALGTPDPAVRVKLEEIFREEGLPVELAGQILGNGDTIPHIFTCSEKCPKTIFLGDYSNLQVCPDCGRPRKKIEIGCEWIQGEIRDLYAAMGCQKYALTCFSKDNVDDAEKILDRAIELAPNFANAYYNRSEIRIAQGNLSGALEDCTQAIRLNPKDADAYVNRGSIKAQQGKYEEAITDTSKALAMGYDKSIAYFNRGLCLFQMGRDAEASSDLKKFLVTSPNDPRADQIRCILRQLKS